MPIETQVVTQARLHPDADWTTLGPGAVELDELRTALSEIARLPTFGDLDWDAIGRRATDIASSALNQEEPRA